MASIIKLYNKILLREHPDLSPVADPSFEKSHSFIYPGDEVVMCTQIDAPTDISGDWTGVVLQAVKMSIIAKKLNIFTEEFSREFAATRSFELDSFIVPLNGINAPMVPWGSDGYAPNVNFTHDRPWQLPIGDFRRQIKGFTTHTPSTSSWKYNFWFPIIFREEYWRDLLTADNDFYDTTKPQNGKNQKWLRYHDLSFPPFGWLIKYKFELQYSKVDPTSRLISGGGIFKIVSEYNLSNEQTGIQDYNSNTDYDTKSIKTCLLAGTPDSNCFVFGSQNTSCFGYFTKLTAWDTGEKDKLSATFRIRPTESGDFLGSRASSLYPVTINDVWAPSSQPIPTDGGIDLEADNDEIIVTDNDGNGVIISFDDTDDKKIIVSAEIDYVKLGNIFPGIQDFTLYCRLYNGAVLLGESKTTIGAFNVTGNQFIASGTIETYSVVGIPSGYTLDDVTLPNGWIIDSIGAISAGAQNFDFNVGIGSGTIILSYINSGTIKNLYLDVYSGNCKMGEELTKQNCPLIPNITPLASPSLCDIDNECLFSLPAFADPDSPTNTMNNDKRDFYFYGERSITAIQIILQKYNSGVYEDIEIITDNTYGKFFAYGKAPDFSGINFTDDFNKKYTGIFLEWIKVYTDYGEGRYRMKVIKTNIFSANTIFYTKEEYCLKKWNCYNIDNTVRIEIFNSGLRGTLEDTTIQIDYYTGWKGEIRLDAIFYETKPNYNKEYNQYGDGDYNALKPIINELIPKFTLDVKPAPGWMDWILSNYILLSDQILITDFNKSNRKPFVKFPVINDGGIDTKDNDFVNPLAWSQITFSYGQNNLRRRNS